ncbi:MAG: NAD-dependent deacylase [Ekhidna sp.]|nr:NAD-dependent deacylase [Ekhidna sp.]
MPKKIVVLTGAGISAESGLKTFRDSDGLWEGHDVSEVATPGAWQKDRAFVLEFYNQRRKQAMEVCPNAGHLSLAELQEHFDVSIITQNIDDLHEKAGSKQVMHLHGEISKVRSTVDPNLIYELEDWELKEGDRCEKGSQLRPHIVWFGEAVPMMDAAIIEAQSADIFIVAGTSLVVYPAASLLDFVPAEAPKFVVDPSIPTIAMQNNFYLYEEAATTGLPKIKAHLLEEYA